MLKKSAELWLVHTKDVNLMSKLTAHKNEHVYIYSIYLTVSYRISDIIWYLTLNINNTLRTYGSQMHVSRICMWLYFMWDKKILWSSVGAKGQTEKETLFSVGSKCNRRWKTDTLIQQQRQTQCIHEKKLLYLTAPLPLTLSAVTLHTYSSTHLM